MNAASETGAIELAVRAVEPRARFASGRQYGRIVDALRDAGRPAPFNFTLPVWVEPEEFGRLGIERSPSTPARVLLMADPRSRQIDGQPAACQLRAYWRTLFRAGVIDALEHAGEANAKRWSSLPTERLGGLACREIRFVLAAEHLIADDSDDLHVYRVFAAVYLDLLEFDPSSLVDFLPSLPEPSTVLSVLAPEVDYRAIRARTRPAGAPSEAVRENCDALGSSDSSATAEPPTRLLVSAREADMRGNLVRAALLRTQALPRTRGPVRGETLTASRAGMSALAGKLAAVFGWDEKLQSLWTAALIPLLAPASRGIWPRSARCLYELQKITADLAGEIYAVDLPEAIRTLGARPIKRPLPHARWPMVLVRLKAAHEQLLGSRVGEDDRRPLGTLLHAQEERVEAEIRRSLAPIITAALATAGICPGTRVEVVARDKLVSELLDRVCDRGRLRIGDLRDSVARNDLKLPDLAGPIELASGDALLRADTQLAYELDGVYRRGEIYLRLIQRFSAVSFGTKFGRFLTLYLALPFGGAFLLLMFGEEIGHIGGKLAGLISRTSISLPQTAPVVANATTPTDDYGDEDWELPEQIKASELVKDAFTSTPPPPHQEHTSHLVAIETVVLLGIFLLLVIHIHPFRRLVRSGLSKLGGLLRWMIWEVPGWLLNSPPVRIIRHSFVVRMMGRYLTGGVAITAIALLVMRILGAKSKVLLPLGLIIFAATTLFTNTRWGWLAQERAAERLADWWRLVRGNLLPGIFGGIITFFRKLADWVERRLYAVDEWLRYRAGDSRRSLRLKAVVGLVWFPFAYFTRFAFYLLVEPQVNPVKHFPVVTRIAQGDLADGAAACDGDGLLRLGSRHGGQRHPGHLRLHGVGADVELAALSGEPPGRDRAGRHRLARRDDAGAPAARVPLRHRAQNLPPHPLGQPGSHRPLPPRPRTRRRRDLPLRRSRTVPAAPRRSPVERTRHRHRLGSPGLSVGDGRSLDRQQDVASLIRESRWPNRGEHRTARLGAKRQPIRTRNLAGVRVRYPGQSRGRMGGWDRADGVGGRAWPIGLRVRTGRSIGKRGPARLSMHK